MPVGVYNKMTVKSQWGLGWALLRWQELKHF